MRTNATILSPTRAASRSYSWSDRLSGVVRHESLPVYLSLFLLLLSTADPGPLDTFTSVCWLVSFAALAIINIGGGFVVYLASLAIYSPLRFSGPDSLLQRPDNLAVVILFAVMAARIVYLRYPLRSLNPCVALLPVFLLLETIVFAPDQLPALGRDCLIPLVACGLMTLNQFGESEINAVYDGLAAIGSYTGLVSILERTPYISHVLPLWIGDPSLRPFDLYELQWDELARSGGTLLQPALNGLLLGMILLVLLLRSRRGVTPFRLVAMALCIAGLFFTYTRGAWLGLGLALLWIPGWYRTRHQAAIRRTALVCGALVLMLAARGMASQRLDDGGTILFRFNLWGAALRLIPAHPLFGLGFFHFGTAMTNVDQGFGVSKLQFRQVEEGVASHNTILTLLVEFGITGCIFYIFTIWKVAQQAARNSSRFLGRVGWDWVIALVILYVVNVQFISCFEGTVNTMFLGLLGMFAGAQVPIAP